MNPVGISFVVTGSVGLVYGLLDLLAPGLTIRWQVRSTSRGRGLKRSVGEAFQGLFGVDPTADPWDNPRVRRSVRSIGVALVIFSGLVIDGGVLLLNRPG